MHWIALDYSTTLATRRHERLQEVELICFERFRSMMGVATEISPAAHLTAER
jgi:hypothetical protein